MEEKSYTNFNILKQTKGNPECSGLPFVNIKEKILGKKYNLSLVFPTQKLATKLHREYKKKDGPANILSFPIDKNEGEIFISLEKSKKEYRKFDMSFDDYIIFLFIHGCLHLKGLKHSAIMESEENRLLNMFKSTTS